MDLLHSCSQLGSLNIFVADVGIMVGGRILRQISKIDPFEVGPEEVENQLRLDKRTTHSHTIAFASLWHWRNPRV